MRMCQTFAPLLIEAKGTIVQIGSIAGIMPFVFGSTYNATKAALHAYSNTLRVELAPFGVRVITVVTGGVNSNIARTDRTLPEGSYYEPVNEEFRRRLTYSQEVGMSNEVYAKRVVRQVLRDGWVWKTRWVWEGYGARMVWFVQRFLPLAVLDWYFGYKFGLQKLRGTAEGRKKVV